jgi:CBS-domain-containing membrane protein
MYPLDQVAVVGPDDSAAVLVARINASPAHRALVLDDGRLVGIVSPSDVSRTLAWAALSRR